MNEYDCACSDGKCQFCKDFLYKSYERLLEISDIVCRDLKRDAATERMNKELNEMMNNEEQY